MNLNPNISLRGLAGIIILSALALFVVNWKGTEYYKRTERPERPYETAQRLSREAEASFHRACSNDVVGFYRLIDSFCATGDEDISKWWGTATVEFFGPRGGVARTNLFFKFARTGGSAYASRMTTEEFSARHR